MLNQGKTVRDPYTFSLAGLKGMTISSFAIVPAVANDRINKIRDGRRHQAPTGSNQPMSAGQGSDDQTAQPSCA